jgi:hypothetical protein
MALRSASRRSRGPTDGAQTSRPVRLYRLAKGVNAERQLLTRAQSRPLYSMKGSVGVRIAGFVEPQARARNPACVFARAFADQRQSLDRSCAVADDQKLRQFDALPPAMAPSQLSIQVQRMEEGGWPGSPCSPAHCQRAARPSRDRLCFSKRAARCMTDLPFKMPERGFALSARYSLTSGHMSDTAQLDPLAKRLSSMPSWAEPLDRYVRVACDGESACFPAMEQKARQASASFPKAANTSARWI